MYRRTFVKLGVATGLTMAVAHPVFAAPPPADPTPGPRKTPDRKTVTPKDRRAAAKRAAKLGVQPGVATATSVATVTDPTTGLPIPHYFGPFANYANSPLPRGSIGSIRVTSAGRGYLAPVVTIADAYGTGAGATATATLANGAIGSVVVTSGGSGYAAPVISFADAAGAGSGATATATMKDGVLQEILIDQAGSGYVSPTVAISDASGLGAGATATASTVDGAIGTIVITSAGSNYSAPVVTIADASGGGDGNAAATALLGEIAPSTGIRKFIDTLPGLGAANPNNLGNYISLAVPDTTTFRDADYYEIELGEYDHRFHGDLPPTRVRGYRQTNGPNGLNEPFSYLGPMIVASKERPVRVKFTNKLPTGAGGNLSIPVDKTVMGAGMPMGSEVMDFPQNRATLHLHGGLIPWISDGTPHQWTTPAGENPTYPRGVSVQFVPDMWFDANGKPVPAGTTGATNDPGPGSLTFYYNNEQSARLMFYHDHSWGITRLNVYAGEAAGYLLVDQIEKDLIDGTNLSGANPGLARVLPDVGVPEYKHGIPLILQDKTFVDADLIGAQDPLWRWGTGGVDPLTGATLPKTGDLWVPSVYMPAQNPDDPSGANPFGRWMYGPWFWPPTKDITYGPVPNEYYDPVNAPWEPTMRPQMPNPSMGMEAFNDTPIVNGAAYPKLTVEPRAYRFRILNAANDRFFNLHFYVADSAVKTADGRANTEVRMVPAVKTPGFPASWSTDGREGGVPDPRWRGPDWIQIGSEGGFLPEPVVIPPQPINWNGNATAFNFGNVTDHSLLLGCAERADVIVDFSQYAGKTLILYNDAPAAFPALDPRYDYYTGNPSQMDTGGAPSTQAGYGPNSRTVMQIEVAATRSDGQPIAPYDLARLLAVWAKSDSNPGVFASAQDPIILPQAAYTSAYNPTTPFPSAPTAQYVQHFDTEKSFTPLGAAAPVKLTFEEKAAHDEMGAAYDTQYGRMGGMLGLELLNTTNLTQNIILYGFTSPPVDLLRDSGPLALNPIGSTADGTQIWKITHNGVDTHPIHFHLVNVQVINRVSWDGAMLPPDRNELGWKETVRMNPLEDLIVALRPALPPKTPFDLPNSVRLIDPMQPEGADLMAPPGGFVDPALVAVAVKNHKVNFGWEYVWHCHILSHEEMDMMHAVGFAVAPKAPSSLTYAPVTDKKGAVIGLTLSWVDGSANETGFVVQRRNVGVADWTTLGTVGEVTGTGSTVRYTDSAFRPNATPGVSYQVYATNVVGDTSTYAGSNGFPMVTANSAALSVGAPLGTTTLSPIATPAAKAPVVLNWTYSPAPGGDKPAVDGFVVQRAAKADFTTGLTTFNVAASTLTYSDGSVKKGTTYYYRVVAKSFFGSGIWSVPQKVTTP